MKKFLKKNWGATLLSLLFLLFFFLLFFRILYIQWTGQLSGVDLANKAQKKYAQESILQSHRGEIVDRNNSLIATDTLSYKLIAVVSEEATPNHSKKQYHVSDAKKTSQFLAQYLDLGEPEIYQIIQSALDERKNGGSRYQVEFGRAGRGLNYELVEEMKSEVLEQDISGLSFIEERKRYYPNGIFASHLIGYAAPEEIEPGIFETKGMMGIEKYYNSQLLGTPGKINFESDAWGIALTRSEKMVTPPKDGNKIKLTLDNTIQNIVEDEMTKVEKEYTPDKMTLVVAHAKTGEILAMSQRPTFNPTTREGLSENWLNESVENTFEPGSTVKMFTLAAAIEEGKWRPNATFVSGKYKIYDKTIRDVYRPGWGRISFLEGFQRSSNVSMAYLLESIGDRRFMEYMESFGFGKPVGIGLPNEAPGILLANHPAERLTTSYGQGSTFTAVQMIQAATAIANDGKMMQPFLVKEVTDVSTGEKIEHHEPKQVNTPISQETARQVREILASTVTSEVGTAKAYAIPGYEVGGKTGTAEIPHPDRPGYLGGGSNYLFSFLGMAPIDDPEIIVYASVQHPKNLKGEYGSIAVSKLFNPIMENTLKHLQIAPNESPEQEIVKTPQFEGTASETAEQELVNLGLTPVVIGEGGKVIEQFPTKDVPLNKGSHVLLKTEGVSRLPNFDRWSKKMVFAYQKMSGLTIKITGDGFVVDQNLSEGTEVTPLEPILLQLKTPQEIYADSLSQEEESIEENEP